MSHEYPHKAKHSLGFDPTQGCIENDLGLTSSDIIHEPIDSESEHQEPGGFNKSNCLTLVLKDPWPKSNHQEPACSISKRITIVLKKICHVHTKNEILAPFIDNTHDI